MLTNKCQVFSLICGIQKGKGEPKSKSEATMGEGAGLRIREGSGWETMMEGDYMHVIAESEMSPTPGWCSESTAFRRTMFEEVVLWGWSLKAVFIPVLALYSLLPGPYSMMICASSSSCH